MSGPAAAGLHAAFLLSGIVTVILGPLIPEAATRWGLPPSRLGLLFLAQFLCSSAGAAVSSRRPRLSVVGGYAAVAAGLAAVAAGSFPVALGAMALVGLGLGLSITATNVLVARGSPLSRGAALSRLNLVWGLGAVTSPLLFMAVPPRLRVAGVLLPLAAAAALAASYLGRTLPGDSHPAPAAAARGVASAVPRTTLALGAGQLLLVVGTEAALGGWMVAAYPAGGPLPPLLVGGGFWAAFILGRAAAPALLRRLAEPALHAASLATAALGVALVMLARSPGLIAAGALLSGLGMAPVFPLVVASLTALVDRSPSRHAGAVFAVGGLGGAALPWLVGRLGESLGELRLGFAAPLTAIAAMGLLLALHRSASSAEPGAAALPVRAQGA